MPRGTVRQWNDDDGWGVIDTDAAPGGIWTHFGVIRTNGYATLNEGEQVEVEWEVGEQDGFNHRAISVIRAVGS